MYIQHAAMLPVPPPCSYIEMVHELEQQIAGQGFTDLVMVSCCRAEALNCKPSCTHFVQYNTCSLPEQADARPRRPEKQLLSCGRGAIPAPWCSRTTPKHPPPCCVTLPPLQACGSGGTTAGIGLGCHLAGLGLRVHAMAVCDDEAYFYNYVRAFFSGID